MSTRLVALRCLQAVIFQHKSLTDVLNALPEKQTEKPYIKSLCYGLLRYYWQCDVIAKQSLSKPLKQKDSDIYLLILIGIFELSHLNTATHAATSETVSVCTSLKKVWAKQLVNAILRSFLRNKEKQLLACQTDPLAKYMHPQWLIGKTQKDWPEDFENILLAANQQAPMHLRINLQKTDPETYLEKLNADGIAATKHPVTGLTLATPCDVKTLPDFTTGSVSVQDPSAQLAAPLLTPQENELILDACAAPGGKTQHLLALAPTCQLTAVEINKNRLHKITENLNRTQETVNLIQADAADINTWWDKKPFDKILCDAPCSASGVIRRHPDIKHLRQPEDIQTLAKQQLQLLTQLWQTLKVGGTLLYCTCSIFKAENDRVIENFLTTHKNAETNAIQLPVGRKTQYGWQILPGEENMDGFYYALLKKTATTCL